MVLSDKMKKKKHKIQYKTIELIAGEFTTNVSSFFYICITFVMDVLNGCRYSFIALSPICIAYVLIYARFVDMFIVHSCSKFHWKIFDYFSFGSQNDKPVCVCVCIWVWLQIKSHSLYESKVINSFIVWLSALFDTIYFNSHLI